MKLYDFALAPNPRRVRMFLAEKGIEVPTVQVNLREHEQFKPDFQAVSKHAVVPVLELDDGTRIGESVAICRYFEEVQPDPPLMGIDATDKAIVEMWSRRTEIEGFQAFGEAVRNALPFFEGRSIPGVRDGFPQIPELAERGKQRARMFYDTLDEQLADNEFVAGPRFTVADITAFVSVGFGERLEMTPPETCSNLIRWYAAIEARPSAKA